ncbi:MAG: DotU family type IV/VI secretion system protein [Myxococcota bacterium]
MAGWSLGRAAGDLLAFVQLFTQAPDDQRPDAAGVRARLRGLLEDFMRHPAVQGVSPVDVEEARFALVAFADEMILRTEWPGRAEWLSEPLQLQLFHTNRGGDEFFERLSRLRAEQTDAREVFFLCLAFGFEGQYADREAERRSLLGQQFEMLRVAGRAADVSTLSPLTPSAYEVEIQLPGQRSGSIARPLLAMLGITLGFFALLFLGLYFAGGRVPGPGA